MFRKKTVKLMQTRWEVYQKRPSWVFYILFCGNLRVQDCLQRRTSCKHTSFIIWLPVSQHFTLSRIVAVVKHKPCLQHDHQVNPTNHILSTSLQWLHPKHTTKPLCRSTSGKGTRGFHSLKYELHLSAELCKDFILPKRCWWHFTSQIHQGKWIT